MRESIAYQYEDGHILGFLDCLKYITTVKKYSKEHIRQLREMSYSEYLKTEHWALLKMATRSLYAHSCIMCGKNDVELHVHHIRYDTRGHEDVYKDVECLCVGCHKEIHDIVNRYLKGNIRQLFNSKVLGMANEEIYPFIIIKDSEGMRFGLERIRV